MISYDRFKNNFQEYLTMVDTTQPINFLEIGMFEGVTTRWVLDNILHNPQSVFHGVEPNPSIIPEDIQKHPQTHIYPTHSLEVLPNLSPNYYHMCYIDADHRAFCVLADSVMAWRLMCVGGHMIWDDYFYRWIKEMEPDVPSMRSKEAIDTFLMSIDGCHDVIFVDDNQICIQKTKGYYYYDSAL